jgi:hypothetical protein
VTSTLRSGQSSPIVPPSITSSLRFVDEVPDLTAIFDPTVNVVTLRRPPSPALVEDAVRAAGQVGFLRLFALPPESAAQIVPEELAGFPHLAADLRFWIEVLAELTDLERVGVRLARLETSMCPRFHVDRVTLRLVTTYEGQGTEFVSSEHVDRRRLGHAALGAADEVSGLLLAPGCVRSASAFDVVLLKGEEWPENGGHGAVHRSPAASGKEPRLVLTLDLL